MDDGKTFGDSMTDEMYERDDFKVGMMVLYLPGMNDRVVGTFNVVTDINNSNIYTRRWNVQLKRHEEGIFEIPLEKRKIRIIG